MNHQSYNCSYYNCQTTASSWNQLSPSRTLVTSFTPRRRRHDQKVGYSSSTTTTTADPISEVTEYDDGDWVLCLKSSSETIACASSNGSIHVYDRVKLLPILSQYFPHQQNTNTCNPLITDLIYGPEHTIITIADNGVVIVTDLRQPQSTPVNGIGATNTTNYGNTVIRGWVPESALSISLGYDGYIAAVGTSKGRIHFLDLRKAGTVLGSYVDSHTDAVTQVQFGTNHNSKILLTGSEDGLLCLFDTTQPTEDTAIQSIMNVMAPIRKIGFCSSSSLSSNNSTVYCLTGSETASLWDSNTATCITNFDNWNLRTNLTNEINHCATTHNQQQQQHTAQPMIPQIDYLIDAYWDENRNELQLAAGTNTGDAAVYTCCATADDSNNTAATISSCPPRYAWKANHVLNGGHKGIVRAWCPLVTSSCNTDNTTTTLSNIMITAGEDARLCEWNRLGKQLSSSNDNARTDDDNSRMIDIVGPATTAVGDGNNRRPSLNDSNHTVSSFSSYNSSNSHHNRLIHNHRIPTAAVGGGPRRRQHRMKRTTAPY